MKVTIKGVSGKPIDVEVDESSSVLSVKEKLSVVLDCEPANLKLISSGRILNNESKLSDHSIKENHVIHMVKTGAKKAPMSEPVKPVVPSTQNTLLRNSAQPNASLNYTPNPNTSGSIHNITPNGFGLDSPEMIASMMDSPLMQGILDNPEFLRAMIQSNPEYQQLRETNPEMAEMMCDPQTIRQSMGFMRNPELMNEYMRSNDRAMANIENVPGAFNAISRVYADMQDSNTPSSDPPIDTESISTTSSNNIDNPANPIPNPWAASSNTSSSNSTTNASNKLPVSAPVTATGGLGGNRAPTESATLHQMLSDPNMQTMINQISNDPERLRMLLADSPALSNHPLQQQFASNPDLFRTLMTPQSLSMIDSLIANQPQSNPSHASAFNMASNYPQPPPADNRPPMEKFAEQMAQLKEMGFYDEQTNINALIRTNGNVHMAIEHILASYQ